VKVLRQELASDTEAVARFHREARSASRLDHENIIRVSDFGQTDDGLLFLVMELLDGENLAQTLRRGSLPWRRALTVARDVAIGLSHAHEQGVIHRDLKPENILLVRRGKGRQGMPASLAVKVLDFGLAKLVQVPKGAGGELDDSSDGDAEPDVAIQSLTRTGVVFGTPEYMSPEQAEGRSLDARTDLYALGVVTYQMVTGKLPFSAPTFLALIAKTVNEPPPPLSEQDPSLSVPLELEELALRCLAKSPDDRPQSAEELAELLVEIINRYPEEPSRSGEVAASGSGSITPATGRSAAPAGGVARTVQRHLPPGQTPRTAPKESSRETEAVSPTGESRSPSPKQSGSLSAVSGSASAANRADSPLPRPVSARLQAATSGESARSGETRGAKASSAEPDRLAPSDVEPDALAQSASEGEPADGEAPFTVSRRPYWVAAIVGLLLVGGATYLMKPGLFGQGGSGPGAAAGSTSAAGEREPLRHARELLSGQPPAPAQVEESLRILRDEREVRNTPELHRLLSRAYEAQNNRLRALGHLYTAVRLASSATTPEQGASQGTNALEMARSELALSQLLSRLGHSQDACQTATKLLATPSQTAAMSTSDPDLRRQAEALVGTLHCRQRN
jgi:serine/threonine-protein kinase